MTQKYDDQVVYSPGTVIISATGEVGDIRKVIEPVIVNDTDTSILYIDMSSDTFKPGGSSFAQPLVTGGVCRRVRHPMYAAHVLWGVAQILLLPNLLAGPPALVLMLLLLVVRIPREEQAMLAQFGDAYRDYMAHTGRLFPRLGAPRG